MAPAGHDGRTATEHHEAGANGAGHALPEPRATADAELATTGSPPTGPAAAAASAPGPHAPGPSRAGPPASGAAATGAADADLIRLHVAGDPDAFGQLFLRHRDRLWAVAIRTLSDPEEAADALQDAMISAFRRAESFRGDSAVTTWLHRIVVNACLDRLRRKAARPEVSGDDHRLLDSIAVADPSLDPAAGSDTSLEVAAALK